MKHPKIPVLTMPVWWVVQDTNYGSLFQAYALQQILKRLGYNPEWIQFELPQKSYKNRIMDKLRSIYRIAKWPERLIGRRKRKSISREFRESHPRHFEKFIDERLNVATPICRSMDELKSNYEDSYACIVGSDQMWISSEEQYFLSFIPPGKRIAYAVSAPWGGWMIDGKK